MGITTARQQIEDLIAEEMQRYRAVTEWRERAKRSVGGPSASSYAPRIEQLGQIIECLNQAKEALDRAEALEKQEAATDGSGQNEDMPVSNQATCA